MSSNDRFLGARLSEAKPPLGGGLELVTKDAFWEESAKKSEHGENLRRGCLEQGHKTYHSAARWNEAHARFGSYRGEL
jgi:hypothetical protein